MWQYCCAHAVYHIIRWFPTNNRFKALVFLIMFIESGVQLGFSYRTHEVHIPYNSFKFFAMPAAQHPPSVYRSIPKLIFWMSVVSLKNACQLVPTRTHLYPLVLTCTHSYSRVPTRTQQHPLVHKILYGQTMEILLQVFVTVCCTIDTVTVLSYSTHVSILTHGNGSRKELTLRHQKICGP